jgi:AcrR family transcriptional regulator
MAIVSPRRADPRTPAALVEAAAWILTEEGPAAFSARRLAAVAGTSTMAVYTHFGSMDDLVRAMVHEGFARLHRQMIRIGATDDPVADVVTLGCAYRGNAVDNPHLYAVMFGGSSLGGFSLTDADRQHGRYTLEVLVDAVGNCMAAGRFRPADAQLLGHQMWIALHGLVTLELGSYLIDPYDADACFEAQVTGLMLSAGDSATATARSVGRAHQRYAGLRAEELAGAAVSGGAAVPGGAALSSGSGGPPVPSRRQPPCTRWPRSGRRSPRRPAGQLARSSPDRRRSG